MTRLSVNINKIATLRNARGGNVPDVLQVALDCEKFGAEGITVHPRPDERHITYKDVYNLINRVRTEFNIEGYPAQKFVDMVVTIRPTQVTLVPDKPEAITSNAGWDTIENQQLLSDLVDEFKSAGVRTSIFTGTDPKIIEFAAKTGTDRIELYTEPYAREYIKNKETAVGPFVEAAKIAKKLGLGVNAGHDLSLENLHYLYKNIPWLDEVSIGHALISDALYMGLEKTIKAYKNCLNANPELD
ncbi:pyridoxine 5'-phosphate synthase [Dysgonomonas sp. Marseille-P4677]|uniref:pyridoxine 5'-phosphate synthase n=1 Tax=Dysgonomonas sp. Marseille-P4677 TaxID=2364790 RepID=UPI0019140658|nr:pyridoxine 5'-phosphate synthase [Dysgonomonas sp. Marseille-P4677]MBK5722748.1 pyridoxine 5'-phosphate synthase [Dysgonomonas sp. Marseille-P4677]